MILDYFIISIFVKYRTNHETIIAFIDFIVENARTGKATPGRSQTVRKFTGVGWGWMWGWELEWGCSGGCIF